MRVQRFRWRLSPIFGVSPIFGGEIPPPTYRIFCSQAFVRCNKLHLIFKGDSESDKAGIHISFRNLDNSEIVWEYSPIAAPFPNVFSRSEAVYP
jgi:hypothetical protein